MRMRSFVIAAGDEQQQSKLFREDTTTILGGIMYGLLFVSACWSFVV